jgi:3-dehydroquinate synthase
MTTSDRPRAPLPRDEGVPPPAATVTVRVELGAQAYDIQVGSDLAGRVGEWLVPPAGARGLLVSDETVFALYGERVLAGLQGAGWEVAPATVPPGEGSKTLARAEVLYEAALDSALDRGSTIFALGGGVIGDLAGFVAGTFMRGLRFVQVPTTLLAQVDASVGGKTAVDLPRAKNAVGVFHQPALVVADVATLKTLPEREFRSGLAEVVKHAVLADEAMFHYLQSHAAEVLAREPVALRQLVARNCQIKAEVVAADPRESGWRAVLNVGHTVGHALERAAGEWDLSHGEAVAYGLIAEAQVAERMGVAEAGVAAEIAELLRALGLAEGRPRLDLPKALQALRHDKKLQAGKLRLPLVPRVGEVVLMDEVPMSALEEALTGLAE